MLKHYSFLSISWWSILILFSFRYEFNLYASNHGPNKVFFSGQSRTILAHHHSWWFPYIKVCACNLGVISSDRDSSNIWNWKIYTRCGINKVYWVVVYHSLNYVISIISIRLGFVKCPFFILVAVQIGLHQISLTWYTIGI